MEFLDTSVLVRYLTDDPPEIAERADDERFPGEDVDLRLEF